MPRVQRRSFLGCGFGVYGVSESFFFMVYLSHTAVGWGKKVCAGVVGQWGTRCFISRDIDDEMGDSESFYN